MSGSSRWGSFLQQAVAGVESRLDNILGEADEAAQNAGTTTPGGSAQPVKAPDNVPRKQPGSNPANDRLQERLARAIAAKNRAAASPAVAHSRSGSAVGGSPRPSLDSSSRASVDLSVEVAAAAAAPVVDNVENSGILDEPSEPHKSVEAPTTHTEPAVGSTPDTSTRLSSDTPAPPTNSSSGTNVPIPAIDVHQTSQNENTKTEEIDSTSHILSASLESQDASRQPSVELDRSDEQRQQEVHEYIERIDALQAKLQYLSREAAESARKAVASAPSGSLEKKLAEKDEQIALLMEEGQKLSKTEMKYMTVIKKLRIQAQATEKETVEAKKRADKFEKEKSVFAERLRRIDAIERQSAEHQKALAQAQKDLSSMTTDRDTKNNLISQLKAQLQEATSQAKAEEVKAIQTQLDTERNKVADLENDLSSLKIEKELAAGRAKAQLDELRAKGEREVERARVAEVEMKAEQQMLESRLEVLRTRAEEVSSGATGDAQAKLLRQIETLQSQSAIAGENWQRIEASLSSRATMLERERDEAIRKETETRRKAREMNSKSKRIEEDVENLRTETATFQRELAEQKEVMEKLRKRAETAELSLIEARNAFDQEKQTYTAEMQQSFDEEKLKWRNNSSYSNSRAESPVASTHRSLTAEYLGLQNLQTRRASARSTDPAGIDRLASRKTSTQPAVKTGSGRGTPLTAPSRQDSHQSLFMNGDLQDAVSVNAPDQEDYFENVATPSSPHDKMNDMISISTVGAGPSVQLVERMSAAVRRLETEKVSTKEEIARLSSQRDEARAEIVTLMQEVEAKRALDARLTDLEEENTKINARYQTTLEMLGEKSELVEELKADVQDVKQMYRELIQSTLK